MDLDDLHPADDYTHRFFIWHEWIQANGLLTAENVFDYFATSMFYDKQSNNQVLRMQTMLTGQPLLNEAEQLKRFTGVEFAVVHAQPPSLFIIHKRERLSPEEVRPLAAYFIINNRIYQSPDVYTVLSNRLLTSLHSLQSSLDILRSHRPDFTPRTGFVWPIVEQSTEELATKKQSVESEDPDASQNHAESSAMAGSVRRGGSLAPTLAGSKKQQNILPLFNAIRTTAAHSTITFAQKLTESEVHPPEATSSLGGRSPSTPVPTRDGTPKGSIRTPASASQETISRPTTTAQKKKKKRMSNAPPLAG